MINKRYNNILNRCLAQMQINSKISYQGFELINNSEQCFVIGKGLELNIHYTKDVRQLCVWLKNYRDYKDFDLLFLFIFNLDNQSNVENVAKMACNGVIKALFKHYDNGGTI